MLGAVHEDDGAQTATRIALAATDDVDGHDQRALERHIECCLPCQALEARTARAERAFDATFLGSGVPTAVPATPITATAIPAAAAEAAAPPPDEAPAPATALEVPAVPPALAPAARAAVATPPAEDPCHRGPRLHRTGPEPRHTPRRAATGLLVSGVVVLGGGAIAMAALAGSSAHAPGSSLSATTPVPAVSTTTPTRHHKRVKARHHAVHRQHAKRHKKPRNVSSTTAAVSTATTTGGLPGQKAPTQAIGSLGANPHKH